MQSVSDLHPFSVKAADFNADGHPDLAVVNLHNGTVGVLLGTGTGSFGAQTAFAVGQLPLSLAVSDFNEDGHLDLAVANQLGASPGTAVSVLLGTGDGGFGAQTGFGEEAIPRRSPWQISTEMVTRTS